MARKKPKTTLLNKYLKKVVKKKKFPKIYLASSLAILFGTTTFWSFLSAKIQLGNSDQLINTYLFQSYSTFQQATLPAQHSFLIKWPIFYFIKLFGATKPAFIIFTVSTVLMTVVALVYFIYRIEKRPLVLGTICLALASVLLLIPASPYPGALLPINMAMVATRNLEYVVFIGSISLMVTATRIKSLRFWLATSSLGLLMASDKLFLTLSLGAAFLALIYYAYRQSWRLVILSMRWLVNGVLAAAGSIFLLWLIAVTHITHFANQAGVGPYGLVTSAHNFAIGCIYAVIGLFSNFGASPANGATTLRGIPHQIYTNLFSVSGVSYIINIAIFILAIFFSYKVFISIKSNKKLNNKKESISNAQKISVLLMWATLVAVALYALSNHDYVVDARYLTIVLFAGFMSLATFSRVKRWKPEKVVIIGAILVVSSALGIFSSLHSYHANVLAMQDSNNRNSVIAQALTQHPVDVLLGDYWRTVPIKLDSKGKINITPLTNCTQPRQALASNAWVVNLKEHSFAYLLSLDGSPANYPVCSIKQVVSVYGRPNASFVTAGPISQPNELVLFYDGGINKTPPKRPQPVKGPATVLPISVSEIPNTSCSSPMIMNVVAHQDDDLLFMNPDTLNDIKKGYCITTIYLTAGDAGDGSLYWLSRENGSEAAYSKMAGANTIWTQRIVNIAPQEYVTIANPRGNSSIALIFMHLPDGGLFGQGFKSTNYQSLANLNSGAIKTINSVDRQSSYTKTQLVDALDNLMHVYQPTEIRTQSSYTGKQYLDHSDHNAVSRYVTQAYTQYLSEQFDGLTSVPIKYYEGYPIRQLPANVSGPEFQEKQAVFLEYSKHDDSVCKTAQTCQQTATYGAYLSRQYQNSF